MKKKLWKTLFERMVNHNNDAPISLEVVKQGVVRFFMPISQDEHKLSIKRNQSLNDGHVR